MTPIPVPSGRHDRDAETNVLVGGFMMTTMRPTMRPCSGTSLPAADDPAGVPVSTSPQVGGFIIWRCGAHDDGTGLIGVRDPQMNRNTALRLLDSRSSCSRTTARDADGRTTGPTSPRTQQHRLPASARQSRPPVAGFERGGTTPNPKASESRRHPAPRSHSVMRGS